MPIKLTIDMFDVKLSALTCPPLVAAPLTQTPVEDGVAQTVVCETYSQLVVPVTTVSHSYPTIFSYEIIPLRPNDNFSCP
jgi:hypothetical protein